MKTPTVTTFIAILFVLTACTSQPAPPAAATETSVQDDGYTLIWNMPYVLQNGQGAFDFEIHQHNGNRVWN